MRLRQMGRGMTAWVGSYLLLLGVIAMIGSAFALTLVTAI